MTNQHPTWPKYDANGKPFAGRKDLAPRDDHPTWPKLDANYQPFAGRKDVEDKPRG